MRRLADTQTGMHDTGTPCTRLTHCTTVPSPVSEFYMEVNMDLSSSSSLAQSL